MQLTEEKILNQLDPKTVQDMPDITRVRGSVAGILEELKYYNAVFPKAAIEAAIKKQNEITPFLLDIVSDALKNYKLHEPSYMAHTYAIYLLARFREKKLFPLLIDILQLPELGSEEILGIDGVTDYGILNIIASVFNGDLSRIYNLIEDVSAYEYARSAGIDSLIALQVTGQVSREAVVEYLRYLLTTGLEKPQPLMWFSVASAIMDLNVTELYEPMREAFKADLVDSDYLSLHQFEGHFIARRKFPKKVWPTNNYHIIEDVEAEMGRWAAFNMDPKLDEPDDGDEDGDFYEPSYFEPISSFPAVHDSPKIGRNELCLCGSGKKYKKCCLNKSDIS